MLFMVGSTALWIWRGEVARRAFEDRLRADGGPATVEEVITSLEAHAARQPASASADAQRIMAAASVLARANPMRLNRPLVAWRENLDARRPIIGAVELMTALSIQEGVCDLVESRAGSLNIVNDELVPAYLPAVPREFMAVGASPDDRRFQAAATQRR